MRTPPRMTTNTAFSARKRNEVRAMIKNRLKEFIFAEDEVTNNCHASTVLPLADGTVLAAWFGGSREGNDDVAIYVSARRNGAWETPQKMYVTEDVPHWNPVLFLKNDGTVALMFKYGKKIPHWVTYISFSSDAGRTFSKPEELVPGDLDGGRGPVKNKAIRLSDGSVLAPASNEQNEEWKAFVDKSSDDCKTWQRKKYVERPVYRMRIVDMIQPTLWESEKGKVHMLLRTDRGYIFRSDSSDYGETWCKAYKTPLFNNNSGIDIARLSDGSLVLISNPVHRNWGVRTPLTLMRSFDNGETFEELDVLESDKGEYSYPAIVADGMTLHLTYTYNRKTIVYQRIDL